MLNKENAYDCWDRNDNTLYITSYISDIYAMEIV